MENGYTYVRFINLLYVHALQPHYYVILAESHQQKAMTVHASLKKKITLFSTFRVYTEQENETMRYIYTSLILFA